MIIHELKSQLDYITEELNRFREITLLLLENQYTEVDNITPEDLEWGIQELERQINLEREIYKESEVLLSEQSNIKIKYDVASLEMKLTLQICETLGFTVYDGYSDFQNLRLFIKALARENFKLKRENLNLKKENLNLKTVVGDKQSNGDTRTDNLGSSDTVIF